MKTIIAIDPGWDGGIAYYDSETYYLDRCPETEKDIQTHLTDICVFIKGPAVLYLEKAQPMPRQCCNRQWKYAANYYTLKATSRCLGFKIIEWRPNDWMKHLPFARPKDLTKRKNKIKAYVQDLFPQFDVTKATSDALALLTVAIKLESAMS